MGKNNKRNKKDQYVHEDLNTKFLKPKTATNTNRNGGYNKSKPKYDEPIPKLGESVMLVLDTIAEQLRNYMNIKDSMDSLSVADRRSVENDLFNLDQWPIIHTDDAGVESKIYLLNHMVKLDRHIYAPIRVTMAVMIEQNGMPKYFIEAYLTKTYTGSVVIHQMTNNGPNRKWSQIYNIVDGELKL